MVRKYSVSFEDLDLYFTAGDEEVRREELDPLSSTYPCWSSRRKCFEAYICVILGLSTALEYFQAIARYGLIVFVPYIIIATMIGVPLVFIEIMLGRYVMGNVVKTWSMCPIAKGVLMCLLGTTGFNIIANKVYCAYIFKYLFSLYHCYVPWEECRKPWAKENCYVMSDDDKHMIDCLIKHSHFYCRHLNWESSGTQFWKHDAQNITTFREVVLRLFYLLLPTFTVFLINLKGYQSYEKFLRILIYTPIIISFVIAFLAYSSTKAITGFGILFSFKYKHLFDWEMWLRTFESTVTSLSLATLALSCVSTHGKFTDNIFIDVVVVVSTFIFFPSFFVFPILLLAHSIKATHSSAPMEDMVKSFKNGGYENMFIWISEVVFEFPYPNVLWTFLFYLELLMMCLGKQAIMVLSFGEALVGMFPKSKFFWNQIVLHVSTFLLGLPYLLLNFDFEFPCRTLAVTTILLYTLTWQLCYGYKKFVDDCYFMTGSNPSRFWLRISWICMIPLLLTIVVLKMYRQIPNHPLPNIVYFYIALPVFVYVLTALIVICRAAKKKKMNPENLGVLSVFKADQNWGPANQLLKRSRVIFDTRTVTKEFIYRKELFKKPLMERTDFSEQNVVQLL